MKRYKYQIFLSQYGIIKPRNSLEMSNKTITNEMLYELIKEFKSDVDRRFKTVDKRLDQYDKRFDQQDGRFDQNDKRFDQQDSRFDQIDKRFDQQDSRFDQLFDLIKNEKHEREKTEAKLEKIYESRDHVSVRFTRSWMFASFFLALLSATIVLAVDKAF